MVAAGKSPEKVAMLVAMSVSEQMPLADVKNRLSEVVDRLERERGHGNSENPPAASSERQRGRTGYGPAPGRPGWLWSFRGCQDR
jgi:hypothetical protein